MKPLIWKLFLGALVYPLVCALAAAFFVGYITQDYNQTQLSQQIAEDNLARPRGQKIIEVPLAEPNFDAVAWAFILVYVIVAGLMIWDALSTHREAKIAKDKNPEA
jgi:hypothetical protein